MTQIIINKSNVIFYYKTLDMPINKLHTEITDNIVKDYKVINLDINKVLNHIHNGEIYKTYEIDNKMTELVSFIKKGNKIIPPIIRYISNRKWIILDGQHRFGLFLHLKFIKIPFLIKKEQLKYTTFLK